MLPAALAAGLLLAATPDCSGALAAGVADLHLDTPYQVRYRKRPADLREGSGQVTLKSLQSGCVDLLVFSLYLPSGLRPTQHTYEQLEALLETAETITARTPQLGESRRVLYATEGAQALADHTEKIPELVERGVWLYGLVHAWHNDLADSIQDPHPSRGGLTIKGEAFVRAVYEAGGLVDVSHMSDEAFDDVAALAREYHRPLVASHSNARAVTPHKRNLTDAQLRAIAASEGVVGVNFHAPFLTRNRQATLDDVQAHIDHMVRVMGADHVAIGSDLDGLIRPARGLESHAGVRLLARHLAAHGYSSEVLNDLFKRNVLRVVRESSNINHLEEP